MSECNSTNVSLSELFREDRQERGLSQAQAARELGISREHYARLESGKATNPRMNVFGPLFQRKVRFVISPCKGNHLHRHLNRREAKLMSAVDEGEK